MSPRSVSNDLELWREVRCIDIEEATPPNGAEPQRPVSDGDDIRISRIRSVHDLRVQEMQLRQSRPDDLIVYLQTQGSVVQVQDGREILVREGDIASKDKSRPVAMRHRGAFEQVLVHIPNSLTLPIFGETTRFTSRELGRGSPLSRVVVSFLASLGPVIAELSNQTANSISETAGSLAIALLAEQGPTKLEHGGWTNNALRFRAQAFVRRHHLDADLSPKSIASALKVSLRSLQAAFHAEGTTVMEYIWDCRLRHSEQDLTNSVLAPLNISEIAHRNGFSDSAHFSRRFKERFGKTPREYRLWKRDDLSSL